MKCGNTQDADGFIRVSHKQNTQDADGFTFVSHKHRRKRSSKKPTLHFPTPTNLLVNKFKKSKIETLKTDLQCSEFFSSFKEILNCALGNQSRHQQENTLSYLSDKIANLSFSNYGEMDIICYGLGHFVSCMIARYQLAFLMVLKEMLQPTTVSLFDPVFSSEEKSFLEELGLEVLDVNEEAKRTIIRRTIFFMPHCDLPLYNNLLWANWKKENLPKLIIIGNSFQNYFLNTPEMKLKETAQYIYFASDIVSEVRINNNFQFTDIFNDLSVHYFKPNDMFKFNKSDDSNAEVQ